MCLIGGYYSQYARPAQLRAALSDNGRLEMLQKNTLTLHPDFSPPLSMLSSLSPSSSLLPLNFSSFRYPLWFEKPQRAPFHNGVWARADNIALRLPPVATEQRPAPAHISGV